ncbi:MAG: division/cell wall cluster transcriptional repressor MraZ [Candidatus Blackburnbacteria bacterium]|nr:division/cell wall cluster transcriptional repressor MraZ [Candidatus Blackburnbacteria bacterium]
MLVGQYIQKLSKKGRVALPSRFRKEVGERIILSRWYEGSLAIFGPEAWHKVVERVTKDSVLGVPLRVSERFLLGGAFEITLDEQGRFVVPLPLRNYAGMEDEVIFLGLGNRIEVWAKERWEEHEKEVIEKAEEMIEKVTKEK